MAKKSTMSKAADAMKTVAGTALGGRGRRGYRGSGWCEPRRSRTRAAEVSGRRGFKADIAQPEEEIS